MNLSFSCAADFYEKSRLSESEATIARDFTDESLYDEQTEVTFAYADGCIFIRYYSDGTGYYFSPPYELCDGAASEEHFALISEYCRLQAIPEVIVDLLPEELPMALRGAEHYDAEELSDGSIALSLYTECMLIDEIPTVMTDGICLRELTAEFAEDYEKLVKDANLNCHFGYSYCDDMPDGSGEDFIKRAADEFSEGESVTYAATMDIDGEERLVGEGCLYGFCGRGTARASFRVLPEYHRRGIGRAIFAGLKTAACLIGLRELLAEVKLENIPSLSLMRSLAEPDIKDGKAIFRFALG